MASRYPNARLGLLKLDCDGDSAGRETDGRVEHATMAMARAGGMRTATTGIMRDCAAQQTRSHLFVERFDYIPGSSRRFHPLGHGLNVFGGKSPWLQLHLPTDDNYTSLKMTGDL